MKRVKDLDRGDRLALVDDKGRLIRVVEKLVESNLQDFTFVYLQGESTPELLRKEMPLDDKTSPIYLT